VTCARGVQVRRQGGGEACHWRRHVDDHREGEGDCRGEWAVEQDYATAGQDGGGYVALRKGRHHHLRMDGLFPAVREHARDGAVRARQVPGAKGPDFPRQGYALSGWYRGWRLQGRKDWMYVCQIHFFLAFRQAY
jgi:hypothetical protein